MYFSNPNRDTFNSIEAIHEKFRRRNESCSTKGSSAKYSISKPNYIGLDWHTEWLSQRLNRVPASTRACITSVEKLLQEIAELCKQPSACTLEGMAMALVDCGLVESPSEANLLEVARLVAFLALGWQSMLFEPLAESVLSSRLDISDTLNGCPSTTFASATIHYPRFTTALPDLLIGFGLMLPQKNLCLSLDEDVQDAFRETFVVAPGSFNIALLSNLLGIRIKWIDVMAPHMDFDQATNTLFLYRFPSYCVASMNERAEDRVFGTLYGMASTDQRNTRWATEEDITHFLKEILLSYRLLFGQDQASSKKYRITDVFQHSSEISDDLLSQLCSMKRPEVYGLPPETEAYRLDRDFPVLRARIALLQHRLNGVKPRTWRSLWKDKRDTAQWWTFWAVIFFGGAGLILGILQTILQAIQVSGQIS